ncbi:hypothetical protein [Dactylosporangium darangshiense]
MQANARRGCRSGCVQAVAGHGRGDLLLQVAAALEPDFVTS